MSRLTWGAAAFLAAGVVLYAGFQGCTYVVDQREAAIVTLFGEVKEVAETPGLKFKNPLASVTTIPTYLQEYNKLPSNTVTNDKKNILVSFYVKYRVVEPLMYAQTVATKGEAEKRIDDIVYSALKTNVSRMDFDQVVVNRGEVEKRTLEMSQSPVRQYGIGLKDFRIKRTDLPPQILDSVYRRMTEERHQKAQMDRSEGEKQKQIMTADAEKRVTEILAGAYKKKQELMGEGDREALKILSDAYGQDTEFAMFVKTLELYREMLKSSDTRLILSTRGDLLKYLSEVEPKKK
jgi:membrane protease subunit HflC